jgi:hypothetical protein
MIYCLIIMVLTVARRRPWQDFPLLLFSCCLLYHQFPISLPLRQLMSRICAERKSCRWKYGNQEMQSEKEYCSPCKGMAACSVAFLRNNKDLWKGRCHLLHPCDCNGMLPRLKMVKEWVGSATQSKKKLLKVSQDEP